MIEVVQERQGKINLWISREDLCNLRYACVVCDIRACVRGDEHTQKEMGDLAEEIRKVLFNVDTDDGYVEHFDPS